MNKKLIAIAIAGAFAGSSPAVMAAGKVSGFIDSILTLTAEACDAGASGSSLSFMTGCAAGVDADGNAANSAEMTFSTNGEVDFESDMGGAMVRVDLDINSAGSTPSTAIEQAKATWDVDAASLTMGRFNSPVGFEAQDAPDMYQTTHGQLWNFVPSNLDGIHVGFDAGMVNLGLALVNEAGGNIDANSIAFTAAGSPMDGLDLSLGVLTQEDNTASNPTSLETITDVNIKYGMDNWWVNLEVMSFGQSATGSGLAEDGFGLTGNIDIGNGFAATLRFDTVSYEGSTNDSDSTTLAGSYEVTDNLGLVLEINSFDNGTTDNGEVLFEAVGTF